MRSSEVRDERRSAPPTLTEVEPHGPRRRRGAGGWRALLWLGPSLALIAAVVLYPAVELVRASLSQYSITGLYQGSVGTRNYAALFAQPALPAVVANTAVWVTAVVAITVALSLAFAQLLDQRFPGRRLVRWALIVPWAASLIMTAKLFTWIFDYYFGILNPFLLAWASSSGPSTGSATTPP